MNSVDVNPTYDAAANTVKADFVLSISTPATNDKTKTTEEFAQAGSKPTFLGMEAVHLLAYDLGERNFFYIPAEKVENPQEGEDPIKKFPALRDFDLGSLFGPGDVTSSKSSRSVQLAVPVGTNALVLYGKAKKTASSDLQGAVTTSGDVKDISTIKFSLIPRLSTTKDATTGYSDEDAFNTAAFVFARCLNHLIAAGLVDESSFWTVATGTQDRSYAFWWPQSGAPTFKVGTAKGEYTKKVASDGSVSYVENVDEGETPQEWKHGDTQGNYTFRCGQVSWKQLGMMYDYDKDGKPATDPLTVCKPSMSMTLLGESLGDAYSALTTIVKKGDYKELRAGSAFSVLHTMEDLYTIVYKAASASPLNWEEQVVKLLAQEIKRRMDLLFVYQGGKLYYLPKKSGETWNLTSVDVETIIERASAAGSSDSWKPYADKSSLITEAFFPVGDSKGFPINLGLPFGAACLACTVDNDIEKTKKVLDSFNYVSDIPAYGMGEATFPIKNYRYPPELMYYANSPIRVSDNVVDAFPQYVSAWDSDPWTGWKSGKDGVVTSTTRSVAMVNHINYGTALLETNVSFASGLTELEDNYSFTHPGQPNNIIPVSNNTKASKGFVVTGVIIGGQPETVCWDYTRAPDNNDVVWKSDETQQIYLDESTNQAVSFNTNLFDKMIYDKVVRGDKGDYVIGSTSDNIYTFAWDNYDATLASDQQSDVYIALEILNDTGKDFYGELNLIRNGGTFYLIGKLDMKKAKKPSTFSTTTTNYFYPPFKTTDGSTVDAPRVFMQNFMTKAKIVLNRTALQHAYVTMPDLRSSQITLGLVIDMTWQDGLEFNVEIGENPTD
jgi:hypothetical protein